MSTNSFPNPLDLIGRQVRALRSGQLTDDEGMDIAASWGAAVVVVLDMHKPEDHPQYEPGTNTVCARCIGSDEQQLPWPCDTVRGIALALEAK